MRGRRRLAGQELQNQESTIFGICQAQNTGHRQTNLTRRNQNLRFLRRRIIKNLPNIFARKPGDKLLRPL